MEIGRRRRAVGPPAVLLLWALFGALPPPTAGYSANQYFPPVVFQASYGFSGATPAHTSLEVSVAGWNVTTGVPATKNFTVDFNYKINPEHFSMVSAMEYQSKVFYILASWRKDGINQAGERILWAVSYDSGTPIVNETMPPAGCQWPSPNVGGNATLPTCLAALADGTLWAFNPIPGDDKGGVVQILTPNSTVCPKTLEGGQLSYNVQGIQEYSSCVTCANPNRPDLASSVVIVTNGNRISNFTHENGTPTYTAIDWNGASGMNFDDNKAWLISNQEDCSINVVLQKMHLILEVPPPMPYASWKTATDHYSVTRAPMMLSSGGTPAHNSMLYSSPLVPSYSSAVPTILWVHAGQVFFWDYDIDQTQGFLINNNGISNLCSGKHCTPTPPLLDRTVRFPTPVVPAKHKPKPPVIEVSDPFCYGCWILGTFLVVLPVYVFGFMIFNKIKNREEKDVKQLLPHREFWASVPSYLAVGARASLGAVRGKLNEVKDKAPGILPHAASGTPRAGKTTPRAVFGDVEDGSFNSPPPATATANAGEGYGTT